jgi:hypothetical protein
MDKRWPLGPKGLQGRASPKQSGRNARRGNLRPKRKLPPASTSGVQATLAKIQADSLAGGEAPQTCSSCEKRCRNAPAPCGAWLQSSGPGVRNLMPCESAVAKRASRARRGLEPRGGGARGRRAKRVLGNCPPKCRQPRISVSGG